MQSESWLVGLLFAATVAGILWRPRGIHEAWVAGAGAALMLLLGAVSPAAAAAVLRETAPVLAFLAGVLVVAAVAERAGVFTWAALWTARLAGSSLRRLFVASYLLGSAVTILFSLDTTAVVLAPVVFRLVQQAGADPVPFAFLSVYVANVTSLLLPVSNLTNLLVQARYELPFWEFARVMALPALLAGAVNLGLLYAVFRRRLQGRLDTQALEVQVRALSRSPFLRWSLGISAGTILGFGVAGWVGVPLWPVAVAGGIASAVLALRRREVMPSFFVRGVAWAVIPFVVGLFVVIEGFRTSGAGRDLVAAALTPRAAAETLSGPSASRPTDPWATLESLGRFVALTALGSNLVNNIPMTLLGMGALEAQAAIDAGGEGALGGLAPYALLLGVNIGPLLTVVGSLATILSLTLLRQRGVEVGGWQYLRMGLLVMPPTLAAATLGLMLQLR
ncbi:MAG TPA: SLC13 family permease [Limnochordales bacterium]